MFRTHHQEQLPPQQYKPEMVHIVEYILIGCTFHVRQPSNDEFDERVRLHDQSFIGWQFIEWGASS